jgi:glycosyltransferase involved in cell wall biosynthesis
MGTSLNTLLFIDVTTPRPYDPSTIDGKGVGGTEQTVIQIAEGLGKTGLFNVIVEQHNRLKEETYQGKAAYSSLGSSLVAHWVIVLRDPRAMIEARKRFPNAKIFLWSHDVATRYFGVMYSEGNFKDSGCLANLCVSQWHRNQTIEVLKAFGYTGEFRIRVMFNPLSEDAVYKREDYDKNKLMWLASPHKGLDRAYSIFKYLIKLNPLFKLYITNPGYLEDQLPNEEIEQNVVILGTIPHEEAINHLRTSLCLFYPNTSFPETFGKILAEANAVGTPVVTSPIGAAREVLDSHPDQIADCTNTALVVERVMKWWDGCRPTVRGQPKFKLNVVLNEWIRLLHDIR